MNSVENRADDHVDVLIAGGAFAGLSLAIALRQALGPSVSVTVADPTLGRGHDDDQRASAIVAAARRLFETLGVWEAVADGAQPILDMVVTDSRVDDVVRPVFLTFGGEVEPGEPFAHMIENRFLIAALEAKARAAGVQLRTAAVGNFARQSDPASGLTFALPYRTVRRSTPGCSWPPMAHVPRSANMPALPCTAGTTASRPS